MKLAIVGSRKCPHINIESQLKHIPDTIVSGGAIGVDNYAREFARRHGLKMIEFFPDYERYGTKAPLERNKLIVEECDCLIAFWDGESRGTKFTIDYAQKMGKPTKIVIINKGVWLRRKFRM